MMIFGSLLRSIFCLSVAMVVILVFPALLDTKRMGATHMEDILVDAPRLLEYVQGIEPSDPAGQFDSEQTKNRSETNSPPTAGVGTTNQAVATSTETPPTIRSEESPTSASPPPRMRSAASKQEGGTNVSLVSDEPPMGSNSTIGMFRNNVSVIPDFEVVATIDRTLDPPVSNHSLSACLLLMDDTIKLSEWIAYHYTVGPLSHLIVAVDPKTIRQKEIKDVLELWKGRLYIELWQNDTWMDPNLPLKHGWLQPKDYSKWMKNNKTSEMQYKYHMRRQNHFVYRCMERFRELEQPLVMHMDSDEFLVYNYKYPDERNTSLLENHGPTLKEWKRRRLENEIYAGRNRTQPIRQNLPQLNETYLADFIADYYNRTACIMVVGLKISSKESSLEEITQDVPEGIDARKLMTLRHRWHEPKHGAFNKVIINIDRLSSKDWSPSKVRIIHNPMTSRCYNNRPFWIGYDYIWSVLRIHHFVGTYEAYSERSQDSRGDRKAEKARQAMAKRDVRKHDGTNNDLRPWISMFVARVGGDVAVARRLLSALDRAYDEAALADIWSNQTLQ